MQPGFDEVLREMCRKPTSTGGFSGNHAKAPYDEPIAFIKVGKGKALH